MGTASLPRGPCRPSRLLQARILVHNAPCLGAEILQQKDAIFFISFFLIFFSSKESIFQYVELCVQCYEMKILNNIFMAFSQRVWLRSILFYFSGFLPPLLLGANLPRGVCSLLTLRTAAAPGFATLFCPQVKLGDLCSFLSTSALLPGPCSCPRALWICLQRPWDHALHLQDSFAVESGWFHSQTLLFQGPKETRTLCIPTPPAPVFNFIFKCIKNCASLLCCMDFKLHEMQ